MTPEQEILADQLGVISAIGKSARETLPLIGVLPVDDASFQAMTPTQRIATTAMLKEFEQLEGALGSLFRAILRTLGVRLKGLYPLDVANRMAELDILDDPEAWLGLVKLRNELVHEYPLGSSDRYKRVVAAHNAFPLLFDAAERAERVIKARRLLGLRL